MAEHTHSQRYRLPYDGPTRYWGLCITNRLLSLFSVVSHDDTSQRSETDNSRRRFLAGTAGALGGLALTGAAASPALAQADDDGDEDEAEVPPGLVENEFEDDVAILNYALTLEYLEARFYAEGLDNISESDLVDGPLADFGDAVTDDAYDYLETIRDHEETHVATLVTVIEGLDGEPVEEPEFDFGDTVEDPETFIATAAELEDVGVSAYAGAAPFIEAQELVPPALSIHSVEARHASFLRLLDNQIPFPEAYDDPRTRTEVLDIASVFLAE